MSKLVDDKPRNADVEEITEETSSKSMTLLKCVAACAFLYSALSAWNNNGATIVNTSSTARRQLTMLGDTIPSYMESLMKDLRERQKLFDETPPEEVKYWFEYTGPLQVRMIH